MEDLYKKVLDFVNQGIDKVFWLIDMDVILEEKKTGNDSKFQQLKKYAQEFESNERVEICLMIGWSLTHRKRRFTKYLKN